MGEQLQFDDEEINITLRRAWDRALRSLSVRVNKPAFETHIRILRPLALSEGIENCKSVYYITLGCPSAFAREWVEKRHGLLIASILEEILDCNVRLTFGLSPKEERSQVAGRRSQEEGKETSPVSLFSDSAPSPTESLPATRDPRPATAPAAPATPARTPAAAKSGSGAERADAPSLNPRYTFENFIVGSSNRLAHMGAQAVAQKPGEIYNPLFLYGSPGLGKTHLMHAIGNEVAQAQGAGSSRVAYISGESFTSHFVTSLREHKSEEFRHKWRNVDIWLVDDIQFIAGREHTKEEFFHTFNALYQTGKQIVISSDRSPRELRMMDERLRSRFECGLIADIAPPDLETRLAILHRKADVERTRIPDEVLLYMARLVQSNIRTLEGALVKIIACASLQNSPVTTELASNVLERYYISAGIGDAIERAKNGESPEGTGTSGETSRPLSLELRGRITPEMVKQAVARHFNLPMEALTGKKRERDIVNARQIAMHLIRELTETSLPGIGNLFGKDHSTVVHSCDRMRTQIPKDDALRKLIEDLIIQIQSQAGG